MLLQACACLHYLDLFHIDLALVHDVSSVSSYLSVDPKRGLDACFFPEHDTFYGHESMLAAVQRWKAGGFKVFGSSCPTLHPVLLSFQPI